MFLNEVSYAYQGIYLFKTQESSNIIKYYYKLK